MNRFIKVLNYIAQSPEVMPGDILEVDGVKVVLECESSKGIMVYLENGSDFIYLASGKGALEKEYEFIENKTKG